MHPIFSAPFAEQHRAALLAAAERRRTARLADGATAAGGPAPRRSRPWGRFGVMRASTRRGDPAAAKPSLFLAARGGAGTSAVLPAP
jgi:hypothetical protein